jgi:hypothetical protein
VLLAMTDDEGLSVREAVGCGSGVTVREVTRLRQLAHDRPGHDPVGPPAGRLLFASAARAVADPSSAAAPAPSSGFPPNIVAAEPTPTKAVALPALRPSWYFLWRHKSYRASTETRTIVAKHLVVIAAVTLPITSLSARMNVINPFAFDSQTGLVVSIRSSEGRERDNHAGDWRAATLS